MKSTQCDISSLYEEDAYAGVHPDDMQRVKEAFEYAIKNISSVNESYRLRNKKNEYVWINVRAVPLKESDDALFFYCIYTNITKERELLEKAIVSKQTIKIAVEQSKINVWTLYIAKRTIELSDENHMTQDMDYSLLVDVPDTLIKEGVIFEDDIQSIKEMFERIYAGQDRAECIARWRKDDNKDYIWVKTTCTTVFDKMGIPIKAIGSSINITEQKKLEQQYHDFEAYQYLMADDSLSTFKVNVTQDKIEEAIHFEQGIKSLIDIQNMSEFFEKYNHNIPNETHKKLHRKFYNRENLLKAFEEGQTHLTLECQYYIEPDVCHWLRMPINLAQNPDTGDVIWFTYATDIDDEKLMQMVMDDMIHHDYDLIMCVYVDTDYYRILAQSENAPFALDESLTYFKDQALDVIHKH
ncbi:PAS domain-containing protein, partial [Eubacterium aggregans]|uniref:PAS domain-containing protein n=1 Tax=Eubacterium aggregans TaxID=81409 RepID=UPI003F31D4B9